MYEFKLPDLGEGIHEAEILKWYVSVGDPIAEDAPLVEVETDKAAVTIPSPVSGTVVSLAGNVGDVLTVGQVVVVVDDGTGGQASAGDAPGDSGTDAPRPAAASPPQGVSPAPGRSEQEVPAGPAAVEATAASSTATAASQPPAGSVARVQHRGPIPAAPATRRLARELGVDLRAVRATGPGGRVTPEDVRAAAATTSSQPESASSGPEAAVQPASEPLPIQPGQDSGIPLLEVEPLPDFGAFGPVEKEPLRSIRRKVARKMTQASLLVAQVSHTDKIDVTELDALRRRERARRADAPGGKLTLMAFVIKAAVAGLRSWRMFNASLDALRGEIVYKRYYNIGIAVDSPKGLLVPVIRDADRLSVLEISAAIQDLADRARRDALGPEAFRGGTFTVSNIGNLGGFSPNPIVNYPEVALLGMGRAEAEPVVRDGEIVVRTRMPVALSFDHRIADGGEAARFMGELKRRLEDPTALLLEA